jgi:hypothetical protein
MDRLRRAAILTRLVQELRKRGSWCGETHLQKATFFLQELTEVPLGLSFMLYKHGPFSFDLRDELTGLRADELVTLEPQWPYGPRIAATERSAYIQKLYGRTLKDYGNRISFIAEQLGSKDVAELERLATAFYINEQLGVDSSVEERAGRLVEVKPHIPRDLAVAAVTAADRITDEARQQVQ